MQESTQIVTVVLIGTLLFLMLVAFVVISLLFYQRSRYKHVREVTGLKNTYEQELLRANLEIKEQTLSVVAREIHDNIGQILSLVKLNLTTLDAPGEGASSLKLKNAKELTSKAIADLRNLSRTLNADHIIEKDLSASIRNEVEQLQKTGTIGARFTVEGYERPISPQQRLFVFRIFQEAINNVIKHANASAVMVSLVYAEGALMLTVKDDGTGFDPDTSGKLSRGSGLSNMQHRAQLIPAEFRIESSVGNGTLVQLSLALKNGDC